MEFRICIFRVSKQRKHIFQRLLATEDLCKSVTQSRLRGVAGGGQDSKGGSEFGAMAAVQAG